MKSAATNPKVLVGANEGYLGPPNACLNHPIAETLTQNGTSCPKWEILSEKWSCEFTPGFGPAEAGGKFTEMFENFGPRF